MAKYSYITDKTHNNRKIQVESAKRDGSGKNIENNYAKQNGNYQSLTAGLSNNFDTKLTEKDESAYNFRPTATMGSMELEVGSPCKVKKIIGGSVAFNQICPLNRLPATETQNGVTLTNNNDGSVTLNGTASADCDFEDSYWSGFEIGHKVLFQYGNATLSLSTIFFSLVNINNSLVSPLIRTIANNVSRIGIIVKSGTTLNNVKLYPQFIDLTQMFGSTIADYIYSLEQNEAGSGVAWFKRYFPKEYYAYNSGELVSVKTQGKKITHFNQWDEEVVNSWGSVSGVVASKNYIEVLPNTQYYFKMPNTEYPYVAFYDKDKVLLSGYAEGGISGVDGNATFTTPQNAYYMKFRTRQQYGTTYNHDICINFHYDGERDGEYEPYDSETYACDDVELRGIPQLDENNNLAFDGDEYLADGNVTRKYGTYTFTGNEVWDASASGYMSNITGLSNLVKKASVNSDVFTWQINNAGLKATSGNELYTGRDTSGIAVITNGNIFIGSDDYANRSNLVGKTIVFELATPTDENSIPFTEVQECDNWGTEEWLAPTTDTRPCEIPVGHETDYLPDLKAKLEVAPTTPSENGVYVMEHSASGNTYTLIGTWLADNGYVKPTSISGYDNTKTQTLKNVEGVLTWVDEE